MARANRSKDKLLAEANKINYQLRSTFFLRKLKEYNTLAFSKQIAELIPLADAYNWDERTAWGIGEDAYRFILEVGLIPIQVFCHPKLLREHPHLSAYYRNVAALSQKSVSYLISMNVKPYESDATAKRALSAEDARTLATLFNQHITLIIDSSVRSFDLSQLHGLLLASTGAQIDGSWRNAIGDEAEKIIQRLLIKEAIERQMLFALIRKDDSAVEKFEGAIDAKLDRIRDYRGFLLSNQTSILFAHEPDISLIGQNGDTIAVIEVKGGADPAGALERYGAAKKSFDAVHRFDRNTKTIFVASCITPEVLTRVKDDPSISDYYNLTEILGNREAYRQFADTIFSLLA